MAVIQNSSCFPSLPPSLLPPPPFASPCFLLIPHTFRIADVRFLTISYHFAFPSSCIEHYASIHRSLTPPIESRFPVLFLHIRYDALIGFGLCTALHATAVTLHGRSFPRTVWSVLCYATQVYAEYGPISVLGCSDGREGAAACEYLF